MSVPAWITTSEWTYELRDGQTFLGSAMRNGFNVLAFGPKHEHLGYWNDLDHAQRAVERFVSR